VDFYFVIAPMNDYVIVIAITNSMNCAGLVYLLCLNSCFTVVHTIHLELRHFFGSIKLKMILDYYLVLRMFRQSVLSLVCPFLIILIFNCHY